MNSSRMCFCELHQLSITSSGPKTQINNNPKHLHKLKFLWFSFASLKFTDDELMTDNKDLAYSRR